MWISVTALSACMWRFFSPKYVDYLSCPSMDWTRSGILPKSTNTFSLGCGHKTPRWLPRCYLLQSCLIYSQASTLRHHLSAWGRMSLTRQLPTQNFHWRCSELQGSASLSILPVSISWFHVMHQEIVSLTTGRHGQFPARRGGRFSSRWFNSPDWSRILIEIAENFPSEFRRRT